MREKLARHRRISTRAKACQFFLQFLIQSQERLDVLLQTDYSRLLSCRAEIVKAVQFGPKGRILSL